MTSFSQVFGAPDSEGAEWEKVSEDNHTETWRNDYYGEVLINKKLAAHQRQQAYAEGYKQGSFDKEADLEFGVVRQQAVAEFAREVLTWQVEDEPVIGAKVVYAAVIHTLLKQRGIELNN